MTDRLFLGIDGGGTTSRARLTDAAGTRLGEGVAGSSNLNLGIPPAADAILTATRAALADAGLPETAFPRITAGFGLAGANVSALHDALLAHPFPFAGVALASDAATACLGAHDGAAGAILVIGTGSQGQVLTAAGEERAIGGWGFELSDGGSGARLGQQAIRTAILAYDGLAAPSPFTDAILARFGGTPAEAAVWGKTATPRDYGAFVPLLLDHATIGDPVATALLADGAAEVAGLLYRLVDLGAEHIALMGGLARVYPPLLPDDLVARLVPPQGDAMDGALILARRKAAA